MYRFTELIIGYIILLRKIFLSLLSVKESKNFRYIFSNVQKSFGLILAYQQLVLIKKTEQAKLINEMTTYWDSNVMGNGRRAIITVLTVTNLTPLTPCEQKVQSYKPYQTIKIAVVANININGRSVWYAPP